jgi:nucleotide-binding universal stress UspA family protein
MFRTILVPLDGSKLAEQILPLVENLAKIHNSDITLLRVALTYTFPGADSLAIEHQVTALRSAEEDLAGIQTDMTKRGLKVTTAVRYGNDAEHILAHAHDHHFDLIAMSTHGRSGLTQFLIGSVASKILHGAKIPVLLCRNVA